MYFYEILEQIMKEKSISIPDVSRLTGLTDSTIRSILARKNKTISLEVAFKLSKGLQIPIEYLNGEKKEEPVYTVQKENRLKELREYKNKTEKELAEYLQVSEKDVIYYENVIKQPGYEILKKLSDLYKKPIRYITGEEDISPFLERSFQVAGLTMGRGDGTVTEIQKIPVPEGHTCIVIRKEEEQLVQSFLEAIRKNSSSL